MKVLFITLFVMPFLQFSNLHLENTIWTKKNRELTNNCIATLQFLPNGKATSYDCEMNYSFKCTYMIHKDTLTVIENDDSHSEDGGKSKFYKTTYLVSKNSLYEISSGEIVKGKWNYIKTKAAKSDWVRIK